MDVIHKERMLELLQEANDPIEAGTLLLMNHQGLLVTYLEGDPRNVGALLVLGIALLGKEDPSLLRALQDTVANIKDIEGVERSGEPLSGMAKTVIKGLITDLSSEDREWLLDKLQGVRDEKRESRTAGASDS